MLHPKKNNVLYCEQDVVFVFAKLQGGALPVSYTHLRFDERSYTVCGFETFLRAKAGADDLQTQMIFLADHDAVSYTHLDVYKRQTL